MSRRVSARVGQVGRRQRVQRVAHRGRLEVLAVGLEEPDREEERLRRPLGDQLAARPARPRRRGGCRCRPRGRSRARPGRARGAARRPARTSSRRRAACGRGGGRSRRARSPRWARPDHPVRVRPLAGQQRRRGCPSTSARRRTPGGTAGPGRPAAGCSASAPDARRAARTGRCRASAGRGCWASRVHCPVYSDGEGYEVTTSSAPRRAAAARCCASSSTAPASPAGPQEFFERLARTPAARGSRASTSTASTTRTCSSCSPPTDPGAARSAAIRSPPRARATARRPTASSARR